MSCAQTYRSGVKGARVAPDGTGLLCPVHSGHTVVVAGDQSQHIVADHLVLVGVDVVDAGDVQTDAGKERLPPCDRVGADDRMAGGEVVTDILGRAARRHEFVAAGVAGGFEDGLRAGGREGFEERSERWRESIVSGEWS